MLKFNSYINGLFVESHEQVEILNPKNQEIAGVVPALKQTDINLAYESASRSFQEWKKTSLESRIELLQKLCSLFDENKYEIANVTFQEIAKPLNEGIVEIERTIEYIQETIRIWPEVEFTSINSGNKKANIHRVPLGVVLAISPFNYPFNLSLAKIAPALLAGNTIVFKPATNGSLTGGIIAEMFAEAQFPAGVFNLVTGRGKDIGDLLTTHPNISMISFTGGVDVGQKIAKLQSLTPIVLELGGNDAAYIRFDADLILASKEVAKGAFSFSGQRCTAIKRLILHESIAKEFKELLLKEVAKLVPVPLVTPGATKFVEELIADSRQRGETFWLEGDKKDLTLPFHIVETHSKSRVWQEEAFGPILPVVIIKDEENILNLINDTCFGLQNSIFTNDIAWAKEISLLIESGTVNLNRSSSRGPDIFPFSGIKNSGFGTQGIKDALISMTRVLNIIEND